MSEGARRSTRRDYARFCAQASVFAIPIAIAIALPLWALDRLGELRCLDTATFARDQVEKKEELLYGPAYTDCTENLKMVGTIAARADVIVLGTSRSVQVRGAFFRKPFYNAGGTAPRARDLFGFLARIPREAQPKTILLVLDQFFLNDATDRQTAKEFRPLDEALSGCISMSSFLGEGTTRLYRDVGNRKVALSTILNAPFPERIGIRAKVAGSGYRRDGSFRIAGQETFDEVRQRMARGDRRYEPASEVSEALVAEVEAFLLEARARGIDVVAILPPYAPTIYDEMHAQGRWTYVDKVPAALAPRFAGAGDAVFDFTDARPVGLTDREFYDGHHPSERAWGVMLLDVAKRDARMADLVDTPAIERMLAASSDPLFIVPDPDRGTW